MALAVLDNFTTYARHLPMRQSLFYLFLAVLENSLLHTG